MIYTKEHIEHYPPAQWELKLIGKLGNETVAKEKISSGGDVSADGKTTLKVIQSIHCVHWRERDLDL